MYALALRAGVIVKGFVETVPRSSEWRGLPVKYSHDLLTAKKKASVIVAMKETDEVEGQLSEMGFIHMIDYITYKDFIGCIWRRYNTEVLDRRKNGYKD